MPDLSRPFLKRPGSTRRTADRHDIQGRNDIADIEVTEWDDFVTAQKPDYYEEDVSELTYDAVRRWAREAGFARYDFGGATGDLEEGILRFEGGCGDQLTPNFYWKRGFGPPWPLLRKARAYDLPSEGSR